MGGSVEMWKSVLWLVSVLVVFIEAFQGDLMRYRDECVEILEVDASKFPRVASSGAFGLEDLALRADDRDSLAVWKCILKKEGAMSPRGELLVDVFKKRLPADVVETIDFDRCSSIVGDDVCDVAHDMNRCFARQLFGN